MNYNTKDLYDVANAIEHKFKPERANESVVLLKQKMCKTNDLIKQYTDKVKEFNHLKSDLETAKKDARHMTSNYKSAMNKSRELELDITEIKQKNNELTNKASEYEIIIAADKQNIQQLTYKIKEMEEEYSIKVMEFDLQKSSFEDKIRNLEDELKIVNKFQGHKNKKKKISSTDDERDITNLSIETKLYSDVGINVSLCDSELNTKPEIQEKCIMTDEFYNVKNDPYPLFCAKCKVHLFPPPINQICEIMSKCPKLIEPITSPKRTSLWSSLPTQHPEHSDINKEMFSEALFVPSSDLCSDSTVNDPKLQLENSTQDFENIELKNTDVTMDKPTISQPVNSSVNSAVKFTSLQVDCVKEHSFSNSLLTRNTVSIKKMRRKIQLLETKMKQLQRLEKKLNTNHCCFMNHKSAVSLNPDLLAAKIYKSIVELCNKEKKVCCENKRNNVSEKCAHNIKNKKLLNKYNAHKSEFSWEFEDLDAKFQDTPQEIFCNKPENISKATNIQSNDELLYINQDNLISNVDSPSIYQPLKENIDRSDEEHTFYSSEITELCSDPDEMYISDNLLNKDDTRPVNLDCQTAVEITSEVLSFNDAHADGEIVDLITEENNSQNKRKSAKNDRLFKKIRNLKRNSKQANLCINKRKSIELCSNDSESYKPSKKRRIAHTPKESSVLQSDIIKEDSNMVRNVVKLEASNPRQKRRSQRLAIQIQKDSLAAKNVKDDTMNKKCDEKNAAEYIKTYSIEKNEISINEKNPNLKEIEESTVGDDGVASFFIDTGRISTTSVFDKRDDTLIKNTSNGTVSSERITIETCNSDKPDLLHNNATLITAEDLKFEKSSSLKASVVSDTQSRSNTSCEDSQCKKFIESVQTDLHINKQKDIELDSDCISKSEAINYEPSKKRQIAHTSKESIFQSSTVEKDSTHYMVKNIAKLEVLNSQQNRRKSQRLKQIVKDSSSAKNENYCIVSKKCDEKDIIEFIHTHSIEKSINETNSDLLATEDSSLIVNNDSVAPSAIDKYVSTVLEKCKVSVKNMSDESVLTEKITVQTSNNCSKSDVLGNNVLFNNKHTIEELESEKSMPSKTHVTQSESDALYKDSQYDKFTETLQAETYQNTKDITLTDEYNEDKNYNDKKIISKDISNEAFKFQSSSLKDNKIDNVFAYINDNIKTCLEEKQNEIGEKCVKSKITEILDIKTQEEKKIKSIYVPRNDEEEIQTPRSLLNRYIKENTISHKLPCKKVMKTRMKEVCTLTDKFVKEQLQRLVNSDWENDIHYDVIEKLKGTCGPRIIAKCTIEFLSECTEHNYILDKEFTPPAPLMTKFQQKIIALLIDLEMSKPGVISFIQAGIEYKLFKLKNDFKILEIDSIARIYVVLARIKNDREKVRIMCCDALYSMGLNAINFLYVVLTSWPEILPDADANKEILPKCIAFLITSQQVNGVYPKLSALKNLISSYYKYTQQITSTDLAEEIVTSLKDKRLRQDGLETAIILVAKREGAFWMYKSIIQPILLPMIINHDHPCMYSAFSLLGKLMRTYPLKAKDTIVKNISKQLSDLLKSGEGSDDQQEGIISALLSLSRHEFSIVAMSVMKWIPNKSLRPSTVAQIEVFIRRHTPKFWKNYIQKNEMYQK